MRRAVLLVLVASVLLVSPAETNATVRTAVGIAPGADATAVSEAIERRTGTRPESLAPIPALLVDLPRGVSLKGIAGIRYVEPLVDAASRVHAERPARLEAVVPRVQRLLHLVADAAVVRADPRGRHRLGRRRRPPRPRREDPRREELRRRFGASRPARPWQLRGRDSSAQVSTTASASQGSRLVRTAPRREGRDEVPDDPGGGGGEGDSLGRRQRRARDQHEPRRDPRPARPGPRHVLAARGRRGRVRRLERCRRRRGCRELGPGADEPVEVRELSGRAAARPRRERDERHRRHPAFSNRDRIYNDIAAPGLRIVSILPRPLTARFPPCTEQGYSSCGPGGVPRGAGDVVRGAAGERGGSRPAEPASDASSRAGDEDPPVDDASTSTRPRVALRAGLVATPTRAGVASTSLRRSPRSAKRLPAARLLRGERRRRHARVHDLRLESPNPGDGRLLGRPGRRVRDPARAEPAGLRRAHGCGFERRPEPRLLASAGSVDRARRRLPLSRPHVGARRVAAVPLVSPARQPGRTTCRCACRARARRATGSRSSRADFADERARQLARDVAQHACGVADDDDAWRHVLRDDRACADERLLADLDPRTEDRAAADACAAPDRRPRRSGRDAAPCGP